MKIPTFKSFLKLARRYNVSDIFLVSNEKPSVKLNGKVSFLQEAPILENQVIEYYLNQILPSEKREIFESDPDLDFGYTDEDFGRFRINAYLTQKGVCMSIRPIHEVIPNLEELNLPKNLEKIQDFKSGLVIVTGSTGSGKSTTLAYIIDQIAQKTNKHIITIEDPIEYVFKNNTSLIDQREVNTHTLSFHKALKSALRQSADIIFLGEMRDLKTIEFALEAAETGSLVLTTMHTDRAYKVIDRIINAFTEGKQNQIRNILANVLKAIVWQKLILGKDEKTMIPLFEILYNNDEIMNLIRKDKIHQINNAIDTGNDYDMLSLETHLDMLKQSNLIDENIMLDQLL